MTRNLTLAIDDDPLDKVRVLAAMKRTSVKEMVRDFLARSAIADSTFLRLRPRPSRLAT